MRLVITGLLLLVCFTSAAEKATYSVPVSQAYPKNVYWGDTHLHTSFSSGDAYFLGNNVVTPEIAYRFAQGETVTARNGMQVRIRRPLDFLVVADHAEGLGVAYMVREEDPDREGQAFSDRIREVYADRNYRYQAWKQVIERADHFNKPGRFTAFSGYEWSSPGRKQGVFGNLHRVVIFRDGADLTGQVTPFSAYDSLNPEDLWRFLQGYEQDSGGQVLAIPHNPNLSNGEMFAMTRFDGSDISKSWAELRKRYEPVAEVTQLKGDSETHPVLSPTDEFADYQTWSSWSGAVDDWEGHTCCADRLAEGFTAADLKRQKEGEYARSALRRGLQIADKTGVNPFQFGMIGATDAHTSLASADEDNFWGQYPNTPPSATRITDRFTSAWRRPLHWETSASGYAAVWAEENTREALFAAFMRREVYATTGPRMSVRVFGGFGFHDEDRFSPDLAAVGYRKGVPMGGELTAGDNKEMRLLIRATRDPDGANLDRVQVVKGWVDGTGASHEKVFDVALSDNRRIRKNRRARSVKSTVSVSDATYTNEYGEPEFTVLWSDPDFRADESAFYYVRVIEVPTPRWPAYEASFYGIETVPEEVVMVTQERAYTSPIWYTP